MANVEYVVQGFDKKENHRITVKKLLELPGANKIILSVAFLNREGVHLLEKELEESKEILEVIAGCRNGITSIQGVQALLSMGIKVTLVDTGSRNYIYHPKAFLAQADERALSIIGSANLTYGGLVGNIEASAIIDLDLSNTMDKAFVDKILKNLADMRSGFPENVVEIDSDEKLQNIINDGTLIDEEIMRETISIGKSKSKSKVVPPMVLQREKVVLMPRTRKAKRTVDKERGDTVEINETQAAIISDKPLETREVWRSKGLTERDLNIPSGGTSNSTGSMLLKKGLYQVDQQTYFRDEVFKNLKWKTLEGRADHFEFTNAKFTFLIEGIEYEPFPLKIKHDTRTNTATYLQKQPMTHLHWGAAKKLIANHALLGKQMILYEIIGSPDEFLIEIKENDEEE